MAVGDSVAWLQALDPDSNDAFVFSFASGEGDADNHHFSILDNQLILESSPALADQNEYYLTPPCDGSSWFVSRRAIGFCVTDFNPSSTTGFVNH